MKKNEQWGQCASQWKYKVLIFPNQHNFHNISYGRRGRMGCVAPAVGPSSLLKERSETPIVFVVSFVLSATPQLGETAKVYR